MFRNILYTIVFISLLVLKTGSFIYATDLSSKNDSVIELKDRAVALARKGDYVQALSFLNQALSQSDRDPKILFDYIAVLAWAGHATDAIKEYEALPKLPKCPGYVRLAVAKSYRDNKRFDDAASVYKTLIEETPSNTKAIAGLALSLVDTKNYAKALSVVKPAIAANPDDPDLLFAEAFIYNEQKDYLLSLQDYNHLLKIAPGNVAGINLKARLLADMGALELSTDFAKAHTGKITPDTQFYINSDMAAKRINWGEETIATNILANLILKAPTPEQALRSRFDMILALAAMDKAKDVINEYEALLEDEVKMPYWILDAAASSYLTLRQPKKAIDLYLQVLAIRPDRFDTRLGLYFAYIETEQFGKAGKVRDKLDKETPEWIIRRGLPRYNWNKQTVLMEKGWWLLYQDRLKDGEVFFDGLRDQAPANLSVRTGEGTAHSWRGWPHRSLEDFDVVITMAGRSPFEQPDYVQEREMAAKNGRMTALNECYFKKEARCYGEKLLDRNRKNLHTARINRQFDIEDSTEFYLDLIFTEEHPGVKDDYLYAKLTQPITPDFDVYGFWLHRRTYDENNDYEYKRAGIGADWNLLPELTVKSDYSINSDDSNDPGILTRLTYRVNDNWSIEAGYNSFSLDVPIRARAEAINGKQTDGAILYKSSELFNARAVYSLQALDDGNDSSSYSLYAERALFTRAHIKTKLFAEASKSVNSKTDVPYYSPEETTTYSITHLISHTLYRRYERSFVHRLYLGIGQFDQSLYPSEVIWDGRYEQDYAFSDKTVLLWGVNFRRRFYDSEKTDILSWYLTFRKNF